MSRDGLGTEPEARSYKGVVINGQGNQQERQDDRQGSSNKRNGKMEELLEPQWQRVEEKEGRRRNRGNRRGDKEAQRFRYSKREPSNRSQKSSEMRSSRVHQLNEGRDPVASKEEGETVQSDNPPESLIPIQSQGPIIPSPKVIPILSSLPEVDRTNLESREIDELDLGEVGKEVIGCQEGLLKLVVDEDRVDGFENLTDGEMEVLAKVQEELSEKVGDEVIGEGEKMELRVVDQADMAEAEKKPPARRKLFKLIGTGGNTKKRLVQALSGPRKRNPSKTGLRQEKDHNLEEAAGSSTTNFHQPKP